MTIILIFVLALTFALTFALTRSLLCGSLALIINNFLFLSLRFLMNLPRL
jgi:hypothetical protein